MNFFQNPYPSKKVLQEISKILSTPVDKVRNWFKYERKKKLKQKKEVLK